LSKYTLKPLNKRSLKKYWDALNVIDEQHWVAVQNLEQEMKQDIKIKGIEFFWQDGTVVGIGNEDRTLALCHRT
jgi:hypothetical protein